MRRIRLDVFCAAALTAGISCAASADDVSERVCAQGTFSVPCPEVIWCPAANCGLGIPRADGELEIIYSSDKTMDGTTRRPVQAGKPMSLQYLAGRAIVFEWETNETNAPGTDLPVKTIHYVIMPPSAE